MRILLRRQPLHVPFNRCACAAADTVGFLYQIEEEVRSATGLAAAQVFGSEEGWIRARQLSEQIPDRLRTLDANCQVAVTKYNVHLQNAIRRKNLRRFTDARAALILSLCGMEFPAEGMKVTVEMIERALEKQKLDEKQSKALR